MSQVVLSPDARFLLIRAGREITRAYRGKPIEDVARDCGIGSKRLDEILGAFIKAGFWSFNEKPRSGFVTRKGLEVAVEQAMRYAA